jgi:Ca2+/Na+ antiporter
VAAALTAIVLVPYLALVIGGSELLVRRRLPDRVARPLAQALAARPRREPPTAGSRSDAPSRLVALVVFDVVVILAGSAGMVQAALSLGAAWHVSHAVIGVLILAPLTSIPNAITGVRLGLARRNAALVGETFNSNTINLGVGVVVPALFTPLVVLTTTARLQLAWLVGMTLVCVALLARRNGMGRAGAFALIVLYLGFAATQLAA